MPRVFQLMLLLSHVERTTRHMTDDPCIDWTLDGRAFAVHDKATFVKDLLPSFFPQSKFTSFTRKLYRWGFRQVNLKEEMHEFRSSPKRIVGTKQGSRGSLPVVFSHESFQRDNKALMVQMRSVTAAGTRRALAAVAIQQHKQIIEAASIAQPGKTRDSAHHREGIGCPDNSVQGNQAFVLPSHVEAGSGQTGTQLSRPIQNNPPGTCPISPPGVQRTYWTPFPDPHNNMTPQTMITNHDTPTGWPGLPASPSLAGFPASQTVTTCNQVLQSAASAAHFHRQLQQGVEQQFHIVKSKPEVHIFVSHDSDILIFSQTCVSYRCLSPPSLNNRAQPFGESCHRR